MWSANRVTAMLVLAVAIKLVLIGAAYLLPVEILGYLGISGDMHAALIAYAPEVWLSLLALVFGTLIIVVSIASENTPRLVDMFTGDPLGRLYIWLIMLSTLENIYLQIVAGNPTAFFSNLIFVNNYILLPISVLSAIPYTFYILKFTKNTNVIAFIFEENVRAIQRSSSQKPEDVERNQRVLFETVNQLHDLLQYTQFKEPKSDVICRLGLSVRIYINSKSQFHESFFRLNRFVREDISFRTLQEKYDRIEKDRMFYEQKVLKVLNAIYLLLINEGHVDLASLCANELVEVGETAIHKSDPAVMEAVMLNFNTLLRYGINHAVKSREIRNAYNVIFYYNQLVQAFLTARDEARIERCCHYFGMYAEELSRLRHMEPQLNFLIDGIAWELKKNLISLQEQGFPRKLQGHVVADFCSLKQHHQVVAGEKGTWKHGPRLIKVSVCLYYMMANEATFIDAILNSIVKDLKSPDATSMMRTIEEDCEMLKKERSTFWEETDRGNTNIYYSDHLDQIPHLLAYIQTRINTFQFAVQ